MIGYLYIIKNLQNNHCYLGSTLKSLNERKCEHFSALNGGYHFNRHLQNAWNLYSQSNFIFESIDEIEIPCVDKAEASVYLRKIETQRISSLNPHYNICRETAGGKLGRVVSEETKSRMKHLMTGRKHSPETIEKIRQARKRQVITLEHKMKISNSLTGIKRKKGYKQTEERKKSASIKLKNHYINKTGIFDPDVQKKRIEKIKNKQIHD